MDGGSAPGAAAPGGDHGGARGGQIRSGRGRGGFLSELPSDQRLHESLARRLGVAGASGYAFDRLFSAPVLRRLGLVGGLPLPRLAERLVRIAFDLVESARSGALVTTLGAFEQDLLGTPTPLPQHPRTRSYWYDPATHSMVGLHLGLDLVRREGAYHFIEANTGAGMRPERRALHDGPFDPVVTGAIDVARAHGFEALVPLARRWSPAYADEFERAGRAAGIRVLPSTLPYYDPNARRFGVPLPQPLQPRTFYWIHSGTMTPAMYHVHDKWNTSHWMTPGRQEPVQSGTRLRAVPTRDRLTLFPDLDPGPRWPNLVVKLAHRDAGEAVRMARFEDIEEAQRALGVSAIGRAVPDVFRRSLFDRARSRLFGGDWALYQPYVAPDLDAEERIRVVRLHVLVSPLEDRFLSSHLRRSRDPLPDRTPRGLIPQHLPFLCSYPTTADYARTDPAWEAELVEVARDFGAVLRAALGRTFELAPPGRRRGTL